MGLASLRERQRQKARNRFWTPTEKDDFRVIVFRRLSKQEQRDGEPFDVLDGWEVESGAPFRMKAYRHLEWQLTEAGDWPPEPGAIYTILFTGMGETEQGRAYQFDAEKVGVAELDGLTQEQLKLVAQLQETAREEAQAARGKGGQAAGRGKQESQ